MRAKCVLLALIWVTNSAAAQLVPAKPLSQADVLGLLITGADDEDVAHLVQKRGIDFVLGNEYLQTLRNVGAAEVLFATLRAAKQTAPPEPTGTAAAERVVLAHARKCARLELKLPWWKGRKKAEKECRAALKYAPDDPFLLLALGSLVGGLGKPDEAIALYRRALALDPSLAAAHVNIAIIADGFFQERRTSDAIAELREAIRIDPDYAAAHWRLGRVLYEKGDLDLAIAEYREALRLEPNSAGLHDWLASMLSRKGDIKGAIGEHRKVVLLRPDATAHRDLGYALYREGDLERAIVEYREALSLEPANLHSHTGLAGTLAKKGDTDGAIAEFREALRLVPNLPEVHNALGYLLGEKEDTDGAIAEYRQALLQDPKLASAHFGLGQAFEKKGDLALALEEYGTAAQLEPNNADYRKRYEILSRKLKP